MHTVHTRTHTIVSNLWGQQPLAYKHNLLKQCFVFKANSALFLDSVLTPHPASPSHIEQYSDVCLYDNTSCLVIRIIPCQFCCSMSEPLTEMPGMPHIGQCHYCSLLQTGGQGKGLKVKVQWSCGQPRSTFCILSVLCLRLR